MSEDRDSLEVLARVASETEANLIVQQLAEQGIAASAVGGFTAGFRAEAPGSVTVWVNRADLLRAKTILAALDECDEELQKERPHEISFRCEECGKRITFPGDRRGHVETCPECAAYVDVPERTGSSLSAESQAPAIPSQPGSEGVDSTTRRWLWIEVLGVLCLAYLPWQFASLDISSGNSTLPDSFVHEELWRIIFSLRESVPLLVIMALTSAPWSLFGIVRPRWIFDLLVGCLIWLCGVVTMILVASVLPDVLGISSFPDAAFRARPEGMAAYLLLVASCSAGGFSEELVMRGYLIPRLEALLRSTWGAVLVTSVLFAGYHLYQGIGPSIVTVAAGLVYGISFCLTRRLWPLCVAHALTNFIFFVW